MKILVFIQVDDNKINRMSLETLACAQSLNASVTAITFNENAANELTKYELDKIIFAKNKKLDTYNPLNYAKSLEQLNDGSYNAIFFAHTYETRDWVPRLSARLDYPFISDCINFSDEGEINFTRPIYQAKLNEKISLSGNGIVSFQAGSFSKDELAQGNSSINEKSLDLSGVELTINPGERFKESADGIDLSTAEVIVSIGRGLSKEENIPLAKSLAEKLNAQIGASRPVVDAGWLDHSYQIGSSGQTVSPKLYLAVGISGAIQHLVGMKGSKNIMAINKDPNAPIFEISDYAVVGDIFEILPKLIEQL